MKKIRKSILFLLVAVLAVVVFGGIVGAAQNVWLDHSIKKYRQGGEDGVNGNDIITLKMARNEFESFQVLIYADGEDLNNVDVEVSNFTKGEDSITDIYIFRECYVNCTTASREEYDTGMWPDALLPKVDRYYNEERNTFPFNVSSGNVQGVWVDIGTEISTVPGTYSATITVSSDGKADEQLTVTLIVWDFILPSTPNYQAIYVINLVCMSYGHGWGDTAVEIPTADGIELTRAYSKAFLYHKMIPDYANGVGIERISYDWNGDNDTLTITDWEPWESIVDEFLDGTSISSGPYAGAKFSGTVVLGTGGYTWDTDLDNSIATEDKETAARQYLQQFFDKYTENGWEPFTKLFVATRDEPRDVNTTFRGETMTQIEKAIVEAQDVNSVNTGGLGTWKNVFVHSHNKRPNIGPFGDYGFHSPNFYSYVCYGWDRDCSGIEPTAPRDEYTNYPNDHNWPYLACDNSGCGISGNAFYSGQLDMSIDAVAMYLRAMSFLEWKYEGDGTFFWGTTYNFKEGTGDPYNDGHTWGANGEGTLFYPGIVTREGRSWALGGVHGDHTPDIGGTHDIPITSIRMKYIRDWMEDTDMMEMASAQEGKAAVDAYVDTLFSNTDITFAYWDFKLDPNILLTARENIAGLISLGEHQADLNSDGIINMPELIAFISRWKAGDGITKSEVEEARGIWFSGGVY
ncbi:MAG: DUF4091 domain-containing protein [Candidatus Altiarchaeota archaeon]|nr:DUF4091 domain-containing protein [Candidatus Altiarchaeota archaeon]